MLAEMKYQMPRYAWHYSPEPIDSYDQRLGNALYGPAQSSFLVAKTEVWNLAWLSHDFAALPQHGDPNFTSLVRRSVSFVLRDGVEDITGAAPARLKIEGLMRLDPAQAVAHIAALKHLQQIPLFIAYGHPWVLTLQQRLTACRVNPAKVLLASMDVDPDNVNDAERELARFTKGRPQA